MIFPPGSRRASQWPRTSPGPPFTISPINLPRNPAKGTSKISWGCFSPTITDLMNHRLRKGIASLCCAALLLAPAVARAQTNSASDNPPPEAASPSTAALINSMDALNDTTKLGNGDRVSYRVIEEQKDPIMLTVTDSGELEVPLLGRYPATGKTCKELAYELKPLLEKDYFYKATVIVGLDVLSTRPRGKVFIMGQVHMQGAIDIPADGNLTVSRAILLDGGLADFADRRKVK